MQIINIGLACEENEHQYRIVQEVVSEPQASFRKNKHTPSVFHTFAKKPISKVINRSKSNRKKR